MQVLCVYSSDKDSGDHAQGFSGADLDSASLRKIIEVLPMRTLCKSNYCIHISDF